MTRIKANDTNRAAANQAFLMRKNFSLFLLVAALFAKAQDVDVLHYTYALRLSDTSDLINGYAEIRFLARRNVSNLSFDLAGVERNGKGMRVLNTQSIHPQKTFLAFEHEGNRINVPLHLKTGDSAVIAIRYNGIPNDGLIVAKNKYGDRTFFADNWPNRAHHWLPCIDRLDDKASFEFIVHAPLHYEVVSNGVKTEEREEDNGMKLTHWKEDTPLPTKVMVIGVAEFATKVFTDSPDGVPVSAWVYPQDSAKGFYDYAPATDIVKFFSRYIGPYPYKKLANVQSKTIFGGMENAGCIFYAENSVTGDRSAEDLLAHEIAHQWFGDMASEKSFAHLWLSEGFATYLTDVYFEQKYGREAFLKRLKGEREEAIAFAKTSSHAVVDSTADLMYLLNANSYQKGAWVLHMLRQEVGDASFHKIIRAYYDQYKGGNADTRDFETVAETVSGKELRWFFDQWLYQAGVPRLTVLWQYEENSVLITPFGTHEKFRYKLPLELTFVYKDEKREKHRLEAWVGGQVSYPVPSKEKPVKILLDSDTDLLFEGTVTEKDKRR